MLLLVGAVGFAAGSTAFAAGTRTVTIGTTLSPKDLTVAPGTTVTWQSDGGKHRLRSTSGPSKLDSGNDLGEGKAWSFTFTAVGSYSYVDHEDEKNLALHGTVTVKTGAPSGPGTTPGAPAPPAPATASVTLANKAFSPSSVTIKVGGTVTWTNNDGSHNVTASGGAFKSPTFATGTFKFTFTKAGTYPYSCTLHGGMNGTVIVQDATGSAPPPVAAGAPAAPPVAAPVPAAVPAAPGKPGKHTVLVSDTGFSPANLNARAGDTVTWVNKGQAPHTATGGGFDLAMDPGASVSTVLQKPGTIKYDCTYHPYMTGSIVVGAALAGVVVAPAPANKGSSGATKPATAAPASKGKVKTVEIKVNEMTFGPAMANANVGDTISWVNVGKIPHTVTAKDGSFDKTPIAPGERFNYVLRKEGTVSYVCSFHPGMDGMLMVGPALAGVVVPGAAAGSQTKPASAAAGSQTKLVSAAPASHSVPLVAAVSPPARVALSILWPLVMGLLAALLLRARKAARTTPLRRRVPSVEPS
jgi:plastocyanin